MPRLADAGTVATTIAVGSDGEVDARAVVVAARSLADRFGGGTTLWCVAADPAGREHARHVAVEFVHPAVVGARALPAACAAPEEVAGLARPDDPVLTFAGGPATVAVVATDPLAWFDGRVVLHHHLLWELTHAWLARGGDGGSGGDPTGFLYPFLDQDSTPLHDQADLEASVAAKAATSRDTTRACLDRFGDELAEAAAAVAVGLHRGGRLLTAGNGGSATDAGLLAELCRRPPSGRPVAARSLAADPAVVTALANDLGAAQVFARQLEAGAGAEDALVVFSTSGDSANVVTALQVARQRGLRTVALVGNDGGGVAAAGLADHCVVVGSDSVHRVQEAHAALACRLWTELQQQARR